MTQEGSFIALSIIVFLHEFLEPAMQNGSGEVLFFHCLGKTDEGAPKRFLPRDVVESSFNGFHNFFLLGNVVSSLQLAELFLAHWLQDDFEEANKRCQFFTRLFYADFFFESVEVEFLELGDVLVRGHSLLAAIQLVFDCFERVKVSPSFDF